MSKMHQKQSKLARLALVALALCLGLLCGPVGRIAALGQSVTARAASSDESRISDSDDGSGSSRSIYSQKHLSPHRMMHFGKRPLVLAPPTVLDLYRQMPPRSPRAMQPRFPLPYTLYFELPRDQVLEFVQPDPKRQLIEAIPDLLEYAKRSNWQAMQHQQQQQQQQRLRQQRFKADPAALVGNGQATTTTTTAAAAVASNSENLVRAFPPPPPRASQEGNPDEADSYSFRSDGGMIKKQSLLMPSGEPQQQQQQQPSGQPEQQDASGASNGQQDGDGINVASRSLSTSHVEGHFPITSDFSNFLYGRRIAGDPQGGSILTLGNFIKKAEPQRNAMKFMHFGRRR